MWDFLVGLFLPSDRGYASDEEFDNELRRLIGNANSKTHPDFDPSEFQFYDDEDDSETSVFFDSPEENDVPSVEYHLARAREQGLI